MTGYHYKAFISYSHKDHRWGRWLHRRLENYRIPKHIKMPSKTARLKPIFRDREDLPAASNLGEKIEQALAASECLIVICSPHAATSQWVNKEILSFKRTHKSAKIFSLIIAGAPYSNNEDECFPPALRFQISADGELTDIPAEPIAADLRKTGDGKRYGMLKLISGMLGVGLDELVQRDIQKNRNRVMAITVGALSTVLAMGTLTGFAVGARNEAQNQSIIAQSARAEADDRRGAAEEMIEFMIAELKPELDAVGRLKPLAIIGERADKYYANQPLSVHNDNALGRRARVFHLIGQVELDDKDGNNENAQARFNAAYASTKALLERNSKNADRVFDHAQSAYWVGYALWKAGKFAEATPYFLGYIKQAENLKRLEPESLRSLQELTYAYTNLGTLLFQQGQYERAYQLYLEALPAYQNITSAHPNNTQFQLDLGNIYGWLSDVTLELSILDKSQIYKDKQTTLYKNLRKIHPTNNNIKYEHLSAILGRIKLLRRQGNLQAAYEVAHSGYIDSQDLYKLDELNTAWGGNFLFFQYEKLLFSISRNNKNDAIQQLKKIEELQASLIISELRQPKKIQRLYSSVVEQYNQTFDERHPITLPNHTKNK